MAFHEKAGQCQVGFDLPSLKSTFLPGGGFAERPGAVKGAFFAAERTLDGEDRSVTIPPGRKVGHAALVGCASHGCPVGAAKPIGMPTLSPPFHPHS